MAEENVLVIPDTGLKEMVKDSPSASILSCVNQTDIFKIVCSKCSQVDNLENASYVNMRQDLETFLNSSSKGRRILMYFKKYKTLSVNLEDELIHMIIDRETDIIFTQMNVTLDNPLKSFS